MKKKESSRKDDILCAARELFAEYGFEKASLGKIIERSGTSKGTLYHYFSNKEELYTCVLETALDAMWSKVEWERIAECSEDTFWASIVNVWKRYAEHMRAEPVEMRLWRDFQENVRSFSQAGPTRRLRIRTLQHSESIVEVGQRLGCVRTDLSARHCAELIEAIDFVVDDWFFLSSDELGVEHAIQNQFPLSFGLIWRMLAPAEKLAEKPPHFF